MRLVFKPGELEEAGRKLVDAFRESEPFGLAYLCLGVEDGPLGLNAEPFRPHEWGNFPDKVVLAKLDSERQPDVRVLTTTTSGVFTQANWDTLYAACGATHRGRP